jgi:hypothetical protein
VTSLLAPTPQFESWYARFKYLGIESQTFFLEPQALVPIDTDNNMSGFTYANSGAGAGKTILLLESTLSPHLWIRIIACSVSLLRANQVFGIGNGESSQSGGILEVFTNMTIDKKTGKTLSSSLSATRPSH